jgi:hypothetical protein
VREPPNHAQANNLPERRTFQFGCAPLPIPKSLAISQHQSFLTLGVDRRVEMRAASPAAP